MKNPFLADGGSGKYMFWNKPISRRSFFKALGATGAAGLCSYGYGYTVEAHRLVVEQVNVPIPGLAARWHNCRVVQLSDLHAGRTSYAHLENAVQMALALKPDFLLITGDFVDSKKVDLARLGQIIAPAAAQVPTLGCTGNHDFAHMYTDPVFIGQVCDTLSAVGVRVLRNQVWRPSTEAAPREGDLCF